MSNSVPKDNIPNDWEIAELRDFLSFISYGFTNPMPESSVGPYMITAKDVTGLKIQYSSARKTTLDAFTTLLSDKSRPKISDLLLTKDGTLGRVALVDKTDVCINQSVAVLRVNERLDAIFLLHLLSSPIYQRIMLDNAGGSAIKHIYITIVDKMKIAVPCYKEQQKIAAILTSVDEVIEKTQAQIDKLKHLKTGMLQELLTVGVGIDGKPHTEFKDSPVGRIPKGWEVKPCKKLCSVITKGTTPTTLGFKYTESGINFIKVESIISNGVIAPYKFSYICEDANKALSRSVIHDKDILITIAGATVGKLAMVNRTHLPANTNQALAIVRVGENKVSREFLFYWLQSEYIKNNIGCIQTVGAQPNLSLAQIGSFSVPLPPINEQLKIVSALQSIDIKLDSVKVKLTKQTSLKKALMQDLLTGKVRVNIGAPSSLKLPALSELVDELSPPILPNQ